jgi:hypothetical protein
MTGRDSRCGARTRAGAQCRGMAVTGTTVCRMHGGAAPQVLAAVERRRADGQRREAMLEWGRTYGEIAPHEDPAVVMAEQIQRSRGHVAWLLERVQETEADALVWGLTSRVEREGGEFPGVDTTYAAETDGWLRLYSEERDRLVRMVAVAARMGVDERLVRIAEVQTEILYAAVAKAFAAAELTAEQQRRAFVALGAALRTAGAERPELAGRASAA